jgi:chromosome partitioning protein
MIISLLNQKGGVGKTTLAVNLARYFQLKGEKILLVDSDSQGSAFNWHERNDGELLDMVCLSKTTIYKDVQPFIDSYDKIFIDGVPQINTMSIATIRCSDIVLIPVTPSPYDIWATSDIVSYVKDRQLLVENKPMAAFIVSRKIVNTNIGDEIKNELRRYELPIFEHGTCQRVAYPESIAMGLTVLDITCAASDEINNIGLELEDFICRM